MASPATTTSVPRRRAWRAVWGNRAAATILEPAVPRSRSLLNRRARTPLRLPPLPPFPPARQARRLPWGRTRIRSAHRPRPRQPPLPFPHQVLSRHQPPPQASRAAAEEGRRSRRSRLTRRRTKVPGRAAPRRDPGHLPEVEGDP